jgi:hypothetical protein
MRIYLLVIPIILVNTKHIPKAVDSYELVIQIRTSIEMTNKHYIHYDEYDRSTAVTRVKKSENLGTKNKLNRPTRILINDRSL